MNRFISINIFLVMFLSCGNSGSQKVVAYTKPEMADVDSKLSASQKVIAYKLDTMFTRMNKIGAFNGSVLVAKGGIVLYHKTMGICNKENGCNLSDTSMFQLASVSKVITATAVLMLHERELIDINKPVSFYFTDFPYANVTVKQLLNHRSGLPNYIYCMNKEIYLPEYKMSNSDMYAFIREKNPKPYLKPDKCFNYCNTNYALLSLLVEKVTNKPFSVFLKEELFEPLGMKHTATIRDIDLTSSVITKPYDLKWKPVELDASDYVLGDKSIYSTAYDLFLFSEALYQNKVLKAETQALAFTPYSKERKLSNYGLGWRLKDCNDPAKKEVFHNGWWHGYRTAFHRRLTDTITIVVLSNQLNKSVYQTWRIYDILDNKSSGEIQADDD
jgi:CubicO group peptidase (beta-lactamase class C family)